MHSVFQRKHKTPDGRAKLLITFPNQNLKDTVAEMKKKTIFVSAYHKAPSERMVNFIELMEKEELKIDFLLVDKLSI